MTTAARIAEETARAQGFPAKIDDPVALAKVAVLVDVSTPPATQRRRAGKVAA